MAVDQSSLPEHIQQEHQVCSTPKEDYKIGIQRISECERELEGKRKNKKGR